MNVRLMIALAVAALAAVVSCPVAMGQAAGGTSPEVRPSGAPADPTVKAILEQTGSDQGLCLHLGCGRAATAGLTAALAEGSRMLVHGLAVDAASRERALAAIVARKLLGQARAEVLPVKPLPYLPDSANVVVIEDFAALESAGLTMDEVRRVTAPGGVILILKDGAWTKAVKPRPAEMDEWTHPTHGADGNLVSSDKLIQFPLGVRWLDGLPKSCAGYSPCRAAVVAGGRVFALSTAEIENIDLPVNKGRRDEYLSARDAFNGLPLWKVKCATIHDGVTLQATNTAPLVTDGKRVYLGQLDKIAVFDAATGRVLQELPTAYRCMHLALVGNMLVTAGWEGFECKDTWEPLTPKTDKGEVEAFDIATGKRVWSQPATAQYMVVADGRVYLMVQGPAPAAQQKIVALDLATGVQKWSVPHTDVAPSPDLRFQVAGQAVLVVSSAKGKTIKVLAGDSGKVLWDMPPSPGLFTPLVNGELWQAGRREPLTGKVIAKDLPYPLSPHGDNGCSPGCILAGGDYVAATRFSRFIDYRPSTAAKDRVISYGAMRGHCLEGAVPANGMLYVSQNDCRCAQGQLPGFVAVGHSGPAPTAADFEAQRPTEQGPALGKVKDLPAGPGDWPMFLRDASRNPCTAAKLPASLKVLWQTPLVTPSQGPLTAAWKARLGAPLTAPVCVGGTTYLAACEEGQVIAVDSAGKEAWRMTLGGRIDMPPTIHRGLCVVGCRDGWVYALRAADGQLAWRTRVAPWERRMVAFGQTESVWPATGSVLAIDDRFYVSAGRTTESDGGVAVVALDVATGKTVWARQIAPGPGRVADILALRDGKIAMFHVQLDPADGKVVVTPPLKTPPYGHYYGTMGGLMDGSWTILGNRRAGNLQVGYTNAEMFAARGQRLWGYWWNAWQPAGRYFAQDLQMARTSTAPAQSGKDCLWASALPQSYWAEAMAMCDSGLVMAGRISAMTVWGTPTYPPAAKPASGPASAPADNPANFLMIVSPEDGKKVFELPLPAAPVYQGLAIVDGRALIALQDGTLVCVGAR